MLTLGSVWLGMDGMSGGVDGTLALQGSIAEGLGSFRGGDVSTAGMVW